MTAVVVIIITVFLLVVSTAGMIVASAVADEPIFMYYILGGLIWVTLSASAIYFVLQII